VLVVVAAGHASLPAQAGSWDIKFNHQYQTFRTHPALGQEVWPTNLIAQPFGINPVSGTNSSGTNPQLRQFNAAHATIVPVGSSNDPLGYMRGMVLVWEGDANYIRHLPGFQRYSLIDPLQDPTQTNGPVMFRNYYMDLGGASSPPAATGSLFCTLGAWTEDGNFFVAGGNHPTQTWTGASHTAYFEPLTYDPNGWVQALGRWRSAAQSLMSPRWYPTAFHVGQNAKRVLVMGGQVAPGTVNTDYESFVAPSLAGITAEVWGGTNRLFAGPGTGFPTFWDFPRMHLLSNGQGFLAGKDQGFARLTHTPGTNAQWQPFPGSVSTGWMSTVLAPNLNQQKDRIIRMDSLGNVQMAHGLTQNDVNWPSLPSTAVTRNYPSAVLLPDGSIFLIGGEVVTSNPKPELLRLRDIGLPGFGWVQGDSYENFGKKRDYHSCAILLPDARVFVCGGENRDADYAIFRPYYLQLGITRPVILSGPSAMTYPGGDIPLYEFRVSLGTIVGTTATRIVLMRPGMATHHNDMQQRYVELSTLLISDTATERKITVASPASISDAPAGWYMVFAVTDQGVPSVASWVKLQ